MKKRIAILAGGYSKEREISLLTGKEVNKVLKKKYFTKLLDPKGDLVKKLRQFKPDIVFNALHGRYGEDGYIQSILENERVKYTHSGVLSSSLSIDKEISKKIFNENKILTPKAFKISLNSIDKESLLIKKINKLFKFPVVIKPINEGSSVGVYICNNKNFKKCLNKLINYDEIIIEQYIPGREIQAAILGKKKIGAIELIPKRKFYDYKAKYSKKAKTKHLMPANLSKKKYDEVNKIALKAHKLLKCRGVSRSDFRFYKNRFYLLELNTQPGMTSLSLVPEIANYNNISFNKLLEILIKDASIDK
tara:strand:- start:128 stop:1045 length:918 start_codon:yes stop_codon:yes gene_type:complete